ncbi:MAG: hypothetical protein ACRC8Y_10070 [Chroococcales cyanobacterium]
MSLVDGGGSGGYSTSRLKSFLPVRSNDFSRYLVTWRSPSNAPLSGSSSSQTVVSSCS